MNFTHTYTIYTTCMKFIINLDNMNDTHIICIKYIFIVAYKEEE